jgi:hypothetical protein
LQGSLQIGFPAELPTNQIFLDSFNIFLAMHKCIKIEPFFRHHFHTCETFLLNIPQHGLYNFAYSNNPDNALISLIVENGINVRTT